MARNRTAPNSKVREFQAERKWEVYNRAVMESVSVPVGILLSVAFLLRVYNLLISLTFGGEDVGDFFFVFRGPVWHDFFGFIFWMGIGS